MCAWRTAGRSTSPATPACSATCVSSARCYHPQIAFLPIGDRFTMDPPTRARACADARRAAGRADALGHVSDAHRHAGRAEGMVEPKGIQVLELKPGETAE